MLGIVTSRGHSGAIRCPLFPKDHLRPGRPTGDLRVEFPNQALADDFLWTWESDCLISLSLSSRLKSSTITGFETRPVEITVGEVAVEHDKEQFVTVGWGGLAKPESGVRLDESKSCSACGHLVYRGVRDWSRLIDFQQWDGSDIFIVWPLPRFILVTDRAAQLLNRIRTREMKLTPLKAMKPQEGTLSSGRVGYWLPAWKILSLSIPRDIA
jgi:hypothetical protein